MKSMFGLHRPASDRCVPIRDQTRRIEWMDGFSMMMSDFVHWWNVIRFQSNENHFRLLLLEDGEPLPRWARTVYHSLHLKTWLMIGIGKSSVYDDHRFRDEIFVEMTWQLVALDSFRSNSVNGLFFSFCSFFSRWSFHLLRDSSSIDMSVDIAFHSLMIGTLLGMVDRSHLGRSTRSFVKIDQQGERAFRSRVGQLKTFLCSELSLISTSTFAYRTFAMMNGNSLRWVFRARSHLHRFRHIRTFDLST